MYRERQRNIPSLLFPRHIWTDGQIVSTDQVIVQTELLNYVTLTKPTLFTNLRICFRLQSRRDQMTDRLGNKDGSQIQLIFVVLE